MALGKLRREEQIGLGLAIGLHVALLSLFLLRPAAAPAPVPQRISVTLSPETGLNATAPTHEDAAADIAPTLGAPPPAAAPAPVVSPPPAAVTAPPVAKPVPAPKPVAITHPRPEPVKPAPVVAPAPPAKMTPRHHDAKPTDATDAPAAAKPAPKHAPSVKDWSLAMPATPDHQPAGGSRIGNDFLKGVAGGKASGKAQQQGAAVLGPEVKSALSGAIARQLKPHWVAPQGADADQLVTILSWDLNRDGTLAGPPHVVRQEGITDSNRPQAARHAEQAIRAVELAAPFNLPPQYYNLWKHVGSSRFDRTLSQ
jgi:outer membrane biosynthesis protein TonB